MVHEQQTAAERSVTTIDYGSFQQPPSALFRDYLAEDSRVAGFFDGGNWGLEALAKAADRAARFPRDRERLVEAVTRQQQALGATAAAARAAQLAEPDSVVVVTGQQAGLLGGPLYVLHKALAALKVAALLEARRGRPVVPAFWIAADDHDFAEIRGATVLDEDGQLKPLRYVPHHEPGGQPSSRIVIDDAIGPLIDELARSLPSSLHRDACIALVRDCYRPGASMVQAFGRLLSALLPGLVVIDPSDPVLKSLMAPVMLREIAERSPTSRLAAQVGERLLAAGYHQQVPVRRGFLNLFLLMDGVRRALATSNGHVEVRGTSHVLSPEDAARALDRDPGAWSPGVLLRPLAQDLMLPTAAYIGGPAEIAYHAQIGPSYGHFEIPRPVLLPRPSLTLVESAQARALDAEELGLPDLQRDPEALFGRWAREAYPEVEAAFQRTRETLSREMKGIQDTLASLDPTLGGAADAALGRALHQIETLHEKSTRALKKRNQARGERVRRTRDALFPGGLFQERGLSLIGLIARHGPAVAGQIAERMDPWARGHQVIDL